MHYKDGTEAKIGDYVKTRAYVLGEYREVVALVTKLIAGCDSCNLQAKAYGMAPVEKASDGVSVEVVKGPDGMLAYYPVSVCATCKDCELVLRPGA